MKTYARIGTAVALGATLASLLTPLRAGAADLLTVGGASATSPGTADVPIYLRDASGTPLGRDRASGLRVQGLSFLVSFSPASAVTSATVLRGGVLAPLTPLYERSGSTASTAAFLASFQETTNLVPFTLDGAGYGDRVATLRLTLAPGLAPGTKVTLTPSASSLCMASNQGGTTTQTPPASLDLASGLVSVGPFWGDANLDLLLDVFDMVILANHIVGNQPAQQPPFLGTAAQMNLNPAAGPTVDVFDLVLLAGSIVGNVPVLPVP